MISCVITTYKRPASEVKRAIDSACNQTLQNKEIIVVNDAPDETGIRDEIGDLLKEYNVTVKYIVHDRNLGACAARNTGIENASGEYVAFLDDDDEWDNDYLQAVQEKIELTNADIIACDYRLVKSYKTFTAYKKHLPEGNIYQQMIFEDYVGPTSTVVVRRSKLIEAGMFDVNMPARQEYDMWLRVCKNGGTVAYIKVPKVSIYREGKDSITNRGTNHVRGTEMVLQKLLSDPSLASYYEKIKYYQYYEAGYFSMSRKQYQLARKYFKLALRSKMHTIKLYVFIIFSYFPWTYEFVRCIYRLTR